MNDQFVRTNVLAYELNTVALQRQWQLIKIVVPKVQWREYLKLGQAVLPDAVTCLSTDRDAQTYLWLLPQTIKLPKNIKLTYSKVLFHRLRDADIPRSAIVQLLINRHSALPAIEPSANQANELLLVTEQSPRASQCVTLSADVTRLNELVMRVKTYTKTKGSLESGDMAIDWERQILIPHSGNSQIERFRFGNQTGKHYTVGFADLVDEDELVQTKIHFAWVLVNKLREFDAGYFRKLPSFVASQLMLPENPGLPPKTSIWQHFEGSAINVVYQADDPDAKAHAERIVTAMNYSEYLSRLNISATLSNQFKTGIQLQVVHSLKNIKAENLIDSYQIPTAGQWMQHITIENFWPKKSKSATPEPYRDPSMVKVMQELLVKRDLSRGWIHPMSSKLLSTMSTYECVTFLKGSAVNLVELFKMSVSPTGQINITQRMIDLTNLSDSDSVERLCQRIVEQLDSVSWTQWQWIDYVLCFEGDLLTVMTTQRYVMLDEPAISSLLSGGSPKQIVDPEVVIGALEKIQEDQTQIQGYQEAVAQLLDDIQNLPQETWTLGYLKQYLKGKIDLSSKVPYQITFQTKAQKAVIADLYKVSGINFDASARRKADEANVIGLKGMGLTVIDGAYHYFVGTHQPLNTTVEKATKFRKIIPAFDNQYSVEYHYQNMQIMMAVNFVNSARYTVRPPQVKYLREYQNQQLRLRQVALQE